MESFNSFELNKILGAVLGTCLIVLALSIVSGGLFAPKVPAKPGFVIAVAKKEGGAPAAKQPEVPLPVLLAKANVEKGKSTAKQCQSCHTFAKGEPNRVGPNLYNIVDEPRGVGRGFNFTQAMKSKGGKWTFEELNKFLTDPRGYIPGTAMTFAGVKNDQTRADVIAFLDTLSDKPVPLPKPEAAAAPAAGGAAPAAGKAPEGGATPAKPEAPAKPAAPAANGKPAPAAAPAAPAPAAK